MSILLCEREREFDEATKKLMEHYDEKSSESPGMVDNHGILDLKELDELLSN
jgi:hypothetical protein